MNSFGMRGGNEDSTAERKLKKTRGSGTSRADRGKGILRKPGFPTVADEISVYCWVLIFGGGGSNKTLTKICKE